MEALEKSVSVLQADMASVNTQLNHITTLIEQLLADKLQDRENHLGTHASQIPDLISGQHDSSKSDRGDHNDVLKQAARRIGPPPFDGPFGLARQNRTIFSTPWHASQTSLTICPYLYAQVFRSLVPCQYPDYKYVMDPLH